MFDLLSFKARRHRNLSEKAKTDWQLDTLKKRGVIDDTEYDKTNFESSFNKINSIFKGPAKSTISRDEARLIDAVTNIYKPKIVVGIGTYFGYGMSWIVKNMDPDGIAYCIDPDEEVCNMCESNFKKFGYSDLISLIPQKFEDTYEELPDNIDLVWIDALCPMTRKKIYGPIIEKIYSKIKEGGLMLAHNVHNHFPFHKFRSKNGSFKPFINKNFKFRSYIKSRNGLAFAKK